MLKLTKLIDLVSSTVQAILLGKIQFCFLQQEQISDEKRQGRYQVYAIPWEISQVRTALVDREYKAVQW